MEPVGRRWHQSNLYTDEENAMKRAIILLISMAGLTCAQDKKADDQKRLESVTWDLKSHKLIWVVQKGHERNGEFVATSTDKYEISPTMP